MGEYVTNLPSDPLTLTTLPQNGECIASYVAMYCCEQTCISYFTINHLPFVCSEHSLNYCCELLYKSFQITLL